MTVSERVWAYWQRKLPPQSGEFAQGDITPTSVFLYTRTTSPLPWADHYGFWQWFDSPHQLAEYLSCVGMPDMADNWFDRRQYDETWREVRISARSTVARALAAGHDPEDTALFSQMLNTLDTAETMSPPEALDAISDACQAFTARFGSTSWWDLGLEVFPTLQAAAARLASDRQANDEEEEDEDDVTDILDLAALAARGDADAAVRIADAFRESWTV